MRGWISAELDGELSEFESMLMRTHLDRCESCSAFRSDATSFTTTLRAAPLEEPSRSFTVPSRRRRVLQPLRVPAVASLVVSAVAAGGLFASFHTSALHTNKGPSTGLVAFDDQSLRQLQLNKASQVLSELRLRQAQEQFDQIPRHPGFQNP